MLDDSESLDDLTFGILWESPVPTPLWEAFWQAQPDGDAADVERALDQLHSEGIFTFERRPMNRGTEAGEPMTAEDVREAIRDRRYRDPTTLVGDAVWMIPTLRYERWRESREAQL